jgi:hypothetical protein
MDMRDALTDRELARSIGNACTTIALLERRAELFETSIPKEEETS